MGALAGCGGVGASPAAQSVGKQLTVYSSLPLQGPAAGISQQIVGGEKLALADAGGRVGGFTVSYVSLDDSSPTSGEWDPGVTAANAKAAAQDRTTIAYLGDFNSGATAVSLPLTNAAGILQVSPASPYVGLTSSLDAGQGEPERFYLGGRRTFGRVAPGDPVQAAAQVALLRRLKVRRLYVIADQDPFDGPLAQIVAADAERAGIEVRGQDTVTILPGSSFTGEVAKVAENRVQAVFLSATATSQAALLARQLTRGRPGSVAARVRRDAEHRVHLESRSERERDVCRLARARRASVSRVRPARARAVQPSLRALTGTVRPVRVRGDERRAGRDPFSRRAGGQPSGGDRPLLCHPRSRVGARRLLDAAER